MSNCDLSARLTIPNKDENSLKFCDLKSEPFFSKIAEIGEKLALYTQLI